MLNQFEIPEVRQVQLVVGLALLGLGCYLWGLEKGRRQGELHAYHHLSQVADGIIQQIWQQPGRRATNA